MFLHPRSIGKIYHSTIYPCRTCKSAPRIRIALSNECSVIEPQSSHRSHHNINDGKPPESRVKLAVHARLRGIGEFPQGIDQGDDPKKGGRDCKDQMKSKNPLGSEIGFASQPWFVWILIDDVFPATMNKLRIDLKSTDSHKEHGPQHDLKIPVERVILLNFDNIQAVQKDRHDKYESTYHEVQHEGRIKTQKSIFHSAEIIDVRGRETLSGQWFCRMWEWCLFPIVAVAPLGRLIVETPDEFIRYSSAWTSQNWNNLSISLSG